MEKPPAATQRDTRRLHFDAVIFDHDNTLADATRVGEDLFQPAFDAVLGKVSAQNRADKPYMDKLTRAFAACWFTAFDAVAKSHDFTADMTDAGKKAFTEIQVKKESGYAPYRDAYLVPLIHAHMPCFLVTSGFQKLQESKIDVLGMRPWFDEFIVDRVDVAGASHGKKVVFADIVKRHGFKHERVLVVGDNPVSEIKAGNELGMHTVQVLRPRVEWSNDANAHIFTLAQLWPLIGLGDDAPEPAHK